jgi:multidrug efflux pump subunit AcrB
MTSSTGEKQGFNLSRWAITHPSIGRFLFGLILVAGVLGLMRMGQKEDPDFTFRVMVVQAVWPGASIKDMEDQVVNKIERKLQETPHLDFVRSFTRAGSAIITLQVKGDTNAADDAWCRKGRDPRRQAREDLYRRVLQGACRAGADAHRSAERHSRPE